MMEKWEIILLFQEYSIKELLGSYEQEEMIGHDTAINYHTGGKEQKSYAESRSICRKLCVGHPSNKVRCLRLETLSK